MKLLSAARFFDRDSVYDAYTGEYLFKAQFASYDGSSVEGTFQRRRTVSTAPGIVFPERGVVTVHGERWLLGEPTKDGWLDRPIRQTASAKQSKDMYDVLTPGQAADNLQVSQKIYVFADYHKDTTDAQTTSQFDPEYLVTASPYERLYSGVFLRNPQKTLHVRSTQDSTLGFTDMLADEVAYNVRDATDWPEVWGRACFVSAAVSGPVNPITEFNTWGAVGSGLVMDRTKLYVKSSAASSENKPGDMSLLLSQMNFPEIPVGSVIVLGSQTSVSALVTVESMPVEVDGDNITILQEPASFSSKWLVIGYVPYFDANLLHIRRA